MSLDCRGVKVQMICEEESLPFYDVQEQSNKTTAYIASVAGQTFKFTILSKMNASVICHIDGRRMQHHLVRANTITALKGPTMGDLLQRYRFSTLSTIDSDSVDANTQPDLQKLGTIELKILRLSKIGELYYDSDHVNARTKNIGAVSERSKKNGWHVVSLDQEVKTEKPTQYCDATYIDKVENPYAEFVIKYQPSILLRAKGIIKELITQDSDSSNSVSGSNMSEDLGNNVSKRQNAPQADADAPSSKRRKPPPPEGSSRDTTTKLKTASRNVIGVKGEPNEDSWEQGERIQSLENALKVSQDALKSIQSELDRLKSLKSTAPQNACKNERASPISLGSDDGDIIDLTLED